jgi:hypothetical protein
MHYKVLGKAASIDAEFSGRIVSTDKEGYPANPIAIHYEGHYEKALKTKEAVDIATFLKSWRTRTEISLMKLESHIRNKSQELKALENLNIVSINLENSVNVSGQSKPLRDVIIDLFEIFSDISERQGRRDYTASSKTLHVLLPKLFVMWDNCIRCAYGCKIKRNTDAGAKYFTFLKRVQKEGKEAIESYRQEHDCTINEAIERIKKELYEGGFYSFARLLDIYNFQKYTIGDDRLWAE